MADNFAQNHGFSAYFAAHPPATRRADKQQQALLHRYRPRLWVGARQDGPIGFYRDYIAHGRLYDRRRKLLGANVTRDLLNQYKYAPGVTFVHQPVAATGHAIVFARIDHASVACTPNFSFLTYNFVFRDSGLPAGLAFWKAWPLRLVASLDDWHQLDHYTAASVVLNPAQQPVALVLQQHNNRRSYIFGQDIKLPADGRVRLTAALRSNELYPWTGTRHRRRTVQYMSARGLRYLVTGQDKPFYSSEDIIDGQRKISYTLGFLPPDDAFYVFQGALGAARRLPGRSGPPGADYYTSPMFLNRALQTVMWHWREADTAQMKNLLAFIRASRAQGHAATDSPVFQNMCRRFLQQL